MNENSNALHFKIDYSKPIEIADLYLSLQAVQNLYAEMSNDNKSKLFIKEKSKGSIEFVLQASGMNQTMATENTIAQFYNFLESIINKLKNKSVEKNNVRKLD